MYTPCESFDLREGGDTTRAPKLKQMVFLGGHSPSILLTVIPLPKNHCLIPQKPNQVIYIYTCTCLDVLIEKVKYI